MTDQRTASIRTLSARINSYHSSFYFSESINKHFEAMGLERAVQAKMAARSAPLGRVGAGVVDACFYNYSRDFIAGIVPDVWKVVSPEEMLTARLDAVAGYLDEVFGDREDIAVLADAANELGSGLDPVIARMDFSGRVLASATAEALAGRGSAHDRLAGHKGDTPFTRLWSQATIAREYRGDGHVAALVTVGLAGLDALLLDVSTGKGFRPRAAQKIRGYTDEQWQTAQARLADAGLITIGTDDRGYDLPAITEAGAALKEEVEVLTDASVASVWSVHNDEKIDSLVAASRLLIKVLAQSGAYPSSIFAVPKR